MLSSRTLFFLHLMHTSLRLLISNLGFPGSSDGKESACSVGDPSSIPELGRSPGEENDYPFQCSCLENPRDGGACWAAVYGVAQSRTRLKRLGSKQEQQGFPSGSDGKESACNAENLGSILGLGRSPGEGHGNPLQYSCLDNPMGRGAWWATVHGVTSQTQLKQRSTHTCGHGTPA